MIELLRRKARSYKLKFFVFKVLSYLPRTWGDRLYHGMQSLVKTPIPQSYLAAESSYHSFSRLAKKCNYEFKDKCILEFGSGWLPTIPYLFLFKAQCKHVITIDVNKHFSTRRTDELNRFCVGEGFNELKNKAGGLPDQIRYYPNTDVKQFSPAQRIDVVLSRFVLEHVPLRDLVEIHKAIYRFLAPEGMVFHLVSPSDHRAYSDKRLSLYDFLRYSPQEWAKRQTRFDFHNRARLPDYIEVFEEAGFEIVLQEFSNPAEEEMKKFQMLALHQDFRNYTDQELTAASLKFVLKRK